MARSGFSQIPNLHREFLSILWCWSYPPCSTAGGFFDWEEVANSGLPQHLVASVARW